MDNTTRIKVAVADIVTREADAARVYVNVIDQLGGVAAQEKCREFIRDHTRHTAELMPHLEAIGGRLPALNMPRTLFRAMGYRARGLFGTQSMLRVIATREFDTLNAYHRGVECHLAAGPLNDALTVGLRDQQRHLDWIENQLDGRRNYRRMPAR